MTHNRTQIFLENGIYLLIWGVVFMAPILGYDTDEGINWSEVERFWLRMLPFFVLFAVNNYLLVPFFLLRKRFAWYAASVLVAIAALFTVAPLLNGAGIGYGKPRAAIHMRGEAPEREFRHGHPAFTPRDSTSHGHPAFTPAPRDSSQNGRMQPHERPAGAMSPLERPTGAISRHEGPRPGMLPHHRPALFKWGPMLNDWLIAILLVGFNIAIRLLFKSIADSRRLKELESQTLRAELNYLKGQVNPHFFMNTLNNIHALIDMDTEKAKSTVIELSKIMRYVLYEADKPSVALGREIEFLDNYIALMSIRYSGEVKITAAYPDAVAGISIPPLLLITFLENAFKHGIVPDGETRIALELSVADGTLHYSVRNTLPNGALGNPGMGLENLHKRLELIYGNSYTLSCGACGGEYVAELTIPAGDEN
ncbi:histidine kinase [Alistipes sp. OttesenSCG-928-B03]|nr:histidine kinase [Alistipes sp. OttesenSCG-928-B03]